MASTSQLPNCLSQISSIQQPYLARSHCLGQHIEYGIFSGIVQLCFCHMPQISPLSSTMMPSSRLLQKKGYCKRPKPRPPRALFRSQPHAVAMSIKSWDSKWVRLEVGQHSDWGDNQYNVVPIHGIATKHSGSCNPFLPLQQAWVKAKTDCSKLLPTGSSFLLILCLLDLVVLHHLSSNGRYFFHRLKASQISNGTAKLISFHYAPTSI